MPSILFTSPKPPQHYHSLLPPLLHHSLNSNYQNQRNYIQNIIFLGNGLRNEAVWRDKYYSKCYPPPTVFPQNSLIDYRMRLKKYVNSRVSAEWQSHSVIGVLSIQVFWVKWINLNDLHYTQYVVLEGTSYQYTTIWDYTVYCQSIYMVAWTNTRSAQCGNVGTATCVPVCPAVAQYRDVLQYNLRPRCRWLTWSRWSGPLLSRAK